MEEANLVKDLALILISAGAFTIISRALKQPLILGYILAGFLVGPHMGLFPTVSSTADVKEVFEGINLNDAEIIKNLTELIHENIGS